MPSSLTGRITAAFVVVGLAVLLAVGAATLVTLRDLHAGATQAGLSDLAHSLLPQVRQSVAQGDVRGAIADVRERLAERGIDVLVVSADGTAIHLDGSSAGTGTIPLDGGNLRGDVVQGRAVIDGQRLLYAATVLRPRGAGPQAIAFVQPDRSGAQALADIGRGLPLVALVGLAVGGPLAWLLARSVARPLRRLAAATLDLPAGAAEPLPPTGPREVRELTGRFNHMAAALDAGRRRERELLANLRHDLRTPLTVIAGYAEALSDGTARGPEAERAARAIADEAERLERLVAGLGTIEALRDGSAALRPELIEPARLLAGTVERFAARAASAGVELTVLESPVPPPTIVADRLAVERILANLVDNALALVQTGGHVWLDAAPWEIGNGVNSRGRPHRPPQQDGSAEVDVPPGSSLVLTVTDDGPGFPPGAADRAFDRFFRADAARTGPGSGLGLAIVRELAEAHGGWAWAENVAPRGARVGVVLPPIAILRDVEPVS